MKKTILFLFLLITQFCSIAQNVGIGTKTPISKLQVVDSFNNVQLRVVGPTLAVEEASLHLESGDNPFSFLRITKYAPGAGGTIFGISKDNMSTIITGGNAASLLIGTGDGVSPILFGAGTGERMRITAQGRVGIGTTTPANINNLQVHSNDPLTGGDVSIGITNAFTTDASLRGARFRMNNYNLVIANNEVTGKMGFATNFNERMTILPNGNIGINNLNPTHKLHIVNNDNTDAIRIDHNGSNANGVASFMNYNPNNVGFFSSTPYNAVGVNYAVGVWGISGNGPISFTPNNNYGVVGENQNTANGIGVLGISNSSSALLFEAAIVGNNISSAADAYGIIGGSNGSSGAGTVGSTANATAGLLGYAHATSSGPAIKSKSLDGSSKIGLELENGAIKVSGTSRTVFQHIATAGNTSGNETVISNTTLANNATDLLIITPYWDGVYVNAPLGVYYAGGSWRIFRQDLAAMPVGAKFNILVVKQ